MHSQGQVQQGALGSMYAIDNVNILRARLTASSETKLCLIEMARNKASHPRSSAHVMMVGPGGKCTL